MRNRNDSSDTAAIETTLKALANAIRQASGSDEEAFSVLEWMIAEGRISVEISVPGRATAQIPTAA